MSVLTIRDLSEPVKRMLELQAASHGHSMEVEAREIITRSVVDELNKIPENELSPQERMQLRLESVRGIWKGQGSTDEFMRELRGED